jgi:hypothetical protein
MEKNTNKAVSHLSFYINLIALCTTVISGQGVHQLDESVVTSNAFRTVLSTYYYLNGLSFQQEALITHQGKQYAVFYNAERHVTIGRRTLPAGIWELLPLTDYTQSINDAHNTISIGIAPSDGTIHLAFDHHSHPLHYRKSIPDLVNHPENYSWSDSLFGPVTNQLVSGTTVINVTYPRFVSTPQGDLQFAARIGTSGDGESYLWEYRGSTGEWISIGKFVDNPNGGNAYLHGLTYDNTGRLHTTWVKRETPDAATNHDLYYIYSNDQGRTWRNNNGDSIGTSGSDPVTIEEPKVWTIPMNHGLINQEAQTVDHLGRIHVLQRRDSAGVNYQYHYWRDLDGTWHETNTNIKTWIWYHRSKIAVDSVNNIYAIMPSLKIASASASSLWRDWKIVDNSNDRRFYSEPLYDWYRLQQGDGILSILYQERNSVNLIVLDYQLNISIHAVPESRPIQYTNFSLGPNYPNPFNSETMISFNVPEICHVKIAVYTISGRLLQWLTNRSYQAGRHKVCFNGNAYASGLYFVNAEMTSSTNSKIFTHKILLLK